MADEKHEEGGHEEPAASGGKGGGKKKLLIIILGAVLVLGGAGGFVGYKMLSGKKNAATEEGGEQGAKKEGEAKTALIPIDPFVVNLTEHGRYLKVTMQLELANASQQPLVTEKMPNIRDAIITLLSSKSSESVSGPEGKLQLKDEILLRVNQAVGKDVFKNLFFTEFVMQ
jgi:flagellar FliL protein